MAGKKDKSLIYWNMNYKGKLRRTWVMLPICIVVGVIAPFYTANQYGSVMVGIVFDIVLAVVFVLQLLYNMKMAKREAEQNARATSQQNFQQGMPQQGGFAPNAQQQPNYGPGASAGQQPNPYGAPAQPNQQYVPPMPANAQPVQPQYPAQPYPQQPQQSQPQQSQQSGQAPQASQTPQSPYGRQ
ncbi:hypothetical protein [Bifidobacterium catulorum]|uniref:hypothetical protein n=1 Tax=Bifidobacterium catulorum TaxID=1630173 RepID=UPI0018812C48|nr:hypothetical protein [Bifidobacterium catulorum]